MKVSIITVTYNSAKTIKDTLKSVAAQTYPDIEHIIVDGASKDDTVRIAKEFPHVAKIISEPDKGIYDAMNKGIRAATGDIVGILNSDDFFSAPDVVQKIIEGFDQYTDATIADVTYVTPETLRLVRYFSAEKWNPKKFKWGYQPPHETFYLRKKYYDQIGLYKTDYTIAADYELMIRMLLKNKLKYKYLPLEVVTMRSGGVSTRNLKSRLILNQEIVKACAQNGISTNLLFLVFKYFIKIFEYLNPQKKQKT